MNTDRDRHFNPLWPALSLICYWVLVGVLAILLVSALDTDSIHDNDSTLAAAHEDKPAAEAGTGSANNENTGSSSDEMSDDTGTVEEDNNGTNNGTQAEGEAGASENSELEQSPDANQDDSDDDDGQVDVTQGDGNTTGKTEHFSNEAVISTSNSPQIPVNDEELDGENSSKKRILNLLPKERKTKQETQRGKVLLKASQAGKMKGFFGSGSISGNVMFIVDVSSSMEMRSPEGFVRLELLKRELKKVLEDKLNELDKGKRLEGKFSIIAFSHTTTFYPNDRKCYSFKDRRDIKEALVVVDKLSANGGTDMNHAWHEAKPLFKRHNIKSVYFLTDGEDPDFSAHDVDDVKIRINTFALGVHSSVLEEIAKKHKGKYTEVY